jgi:catechol 2,3-dioxygenase-like lactoylglutathione lyase family enzyme
MRIASLTPQLRTTDLAGSLAFWSRVPGVRVAFVYRDFYAGLSAGESMFHLKLTDEPDPGVAFARRHGHIHLFLETEDVDAAADDLAAAGVPCAESPHDTDWGTRELIFHDDQGHVVCVWHARRDAP